MSTATAKDLLCEGFQDAVVVVLGGHGGIGACVAQQAATLGARVVVGSRSASMDAFDPNLRPGAITEHPVDLTDTTTLRALAQALDRTFGRVDVLVNSAGGTMQVPLHDLEALTDTIIDDVFVANARGGVAVIRELLPLLREGRNPVVVNVSSVAARTGVGSSVAYVGSKAAMDAMTVALAKVLAPEIRLLSVAPSALRTGFVKGRPDAFFEKTIAATPLGRLASPEEVATAIITAARLLTASTGITLYVDGGRHL